MLTTGQFGVLDRCEVRSRAGQLCEAREVAGLCAMVRELSEQNRNLRAALVACDGEGEQKETRNRGAGDGQR